MSIDVDLAVLGTIATDLTDAGTTLSGIDTAGSSGVDAGPMTAVIASMVAQVIDSAANVADGLSGTGTLVGLSREYYQRADADAEVSLEDIRSTMQEEGGQ